MWGLPVTLLKVSWMHMLLPSNCRCVGDLDNGAREVDGKRASGPNWTVSKIFLGYSFEKRPKRYENASDSPGTRVLIEICKFESFRDLLSLNVYSLSDSCWRKHSTKCVHRVSTLLQAATEYYVVVYLKILTLVVFTRSTERCRLEVCNLRVVFVVKLIRVKLHSIQFSSLWFLLLI